MWLVFIHVGVVQCIPPTSSGHWPGDFSLVGANWILKGGQSIKRGVCKHGLQCFMINEVTRAGSIYQHSLMLLSLDVSLLVCASYVPLSPCATYTRDLCSAVSSGRDPSPNSWFHPDP